MMALKFCMLTRNLQQQHFSIFFVERKMLTLRLKFLNNAAWTISGVLFHPSKVIMLHILYYMLQTSYVTCCTPWNMKTLILFVDLKCIFKQRDAL